VADSVIAQRIAQVEGVAEVTVNGAEQPAMRVRVNPVAVASMGVSLEDVRNAIANANAASALGTFADIELGVRNSRSAAWFNRQPSVLLVVTKQGDANVIDTVDRIYDMLP